MNEFKAYLLAGAFAAISTTAIAALGQTPAGQPKAPDVRAIDAGAGEMSDAEVRKIDLEQGKVTLKHGTIKNLDMPSMTMVFAVKDKAVLDRIKPGDKVRFRAENANGKLTVTDMASANQGAAGDSPRRRQPQNAATRLIRNERDSIGWKCTSSTGAASPASLDS